jgi:hypothetical protein
MKGKQPKYAICTVNTGYEASLELRKLYQVVPDDSAALYEQIRIIDESGEDYLYPLAYFEPVDLPDPVAERVSRVA